MNELVKFENGRSVTTSLKIAEVFNKRHSNVLRAIENLDCPPQFLQLNFELMHIIRKLQGGGEISDPYYLITRDGFSFLAMGFTGSRAAEFKIAFINAFNEMEKRLKGAGEFPKKQLPQTYVAALRELADEVERREIAEGRVEQMKPKVEIYDRISEAENLLAMNAVAKSLGTSRPKLFKLLRERGILMSNNIPYQLYIHAGYFKTKVKPIDMGHTGIINYPQTFVTAKGLTWLAKGLNKIENKTNT